MKERLYKAVHKQYGSLLRAWRLSFDKTGDGFVSYSEFANAVKDLEKRSHKKLDVDAKALWYDLDADRSQMLSLDEFHKPSDQLFQSFKAFCEELGGVRETLVALGAEGSNG